MKRKNNVLTVMHNGEVIELNVIPHLSFDERSAAAMSMVSDVFSDDLYLPFMTEYAKAHMVFKFYTSFDVDMATIDEIVDMYYDDELMGAIYEMVEDDIGLIWSNGFVMIDDVRRKMENKYLNEMYQSFKAVADKIIEVLDAAETKMTKDDEVSTKDILQAVAALKNMDAGRIALANKRFEDIPVQHAPTAVKRAKKK